MISFYAVLDIKMRFHIFEHSEKALHFLSCVERNPESPRRSICQESGSLGPADQAKEVRVLEEIATAVDATWACTRESVQAALNVTVRLAACLSFAERRWRRGFRSISNFGFAPVDLAAAFHQC
jgi:hypothetical protein